jgi:hypothetical protein
MPDAEHAPLPTLCFHCLEIARGDPLPIVTRWCEHRRTLAIGYKNPVGLVAAWDLHFVPTDRELDRFAPTLAQIAAANRTAKPAVTQ